MAQRQELPAQVRGSGALHRPRRFSQHWHPHFRHHLTHQAGSLSPTIPLTAAMGVHEAIPGGVNARQSGLTAIRPCPLPPVSRRWFNQLSPAVRKGPFTREEVRAGGCGVASGTREGIAAQGGCLWLPPAWLPAAGSAAPPPGEHASLPARGAR